MLALHFCTRTVPSSSPTGGSYNFLHILHLFSAIGGSSLPQKSHFSAAFSSNGTFITKFSIIFRLDSAKCQVSESFGTGLKIGKTLLKVQFYYIRKKKKSIFSKISRSNSKIFCSINAPMYGYRKLVLKYC